MLGGGGPPSIRTKLAFRQQVTRAGPGAAEGGAGPEWKKSALEGASGGVTEETGDAVALGPQRSPPQGAALRMLGVQHPQGLCERPEDRESSIFTVKENTVTPPGSALHIRDMRQIFLTSLVRSSLTVCSELFDDR